MVQQNSNSNQTRKDGGKILYNFIHISNAISYGWNELIIQHLFLKTS